MEKFLPITVSFMINSLLSKAKLLLLKLIHLFAREVLLVKKLENEETKTTQYSTFKTDIIKVGLVFSISNFFITKTCLIHDKSLYVVRICMYMYIFWIEQLWWASLYCCPTYMTFNNLSQTAKFMCRYISRFRIFFRLLVSRWREINSFQGI